MEEKKDFTWEIVDFLKDLVIIVIVVKLITMFLVSIFIINGQSMYASYYDKEFILVDRFSTLDLWDYKKQDVVRWDVVVFKPEVDKVKEFFIKRVIWMPWDTIKIEKWEVFLKKINEKEFTLLDEKYLNKINYWNTLTTEKSIIYSVPEWKYFVMWDNRNHSSDSRSCFTYSCSWTTRDNYIWKEFVIGKVLLDLWYFNYRNFSFTHPVIKEDWKYISTKPKWTSSADSYIY
jgi:signal peptidase I